MERMLHSVQLILGARPQVQATAQTQTFTRTVKVRGTTLY